MQLYEYNCIVCLYGNYLQIIIRYYCSYYIIDEIVVASMLRRDNIKPQRIIIKTQLMPTVYALVVKTAYSLTVRYGIILQNMCPTHAYNINILMYTQTIFHIIFHAAKRPKIAGST